MITLGFTRLLRTPLVVGAIIGLIVGGGIGYYLNKQPYTATSQILVSARDTSDSDSGGGDVYSGDQYVSQRMSTYAQVATSDQVVQPAANVLRMNPDDLSGRIKATVVDSTTMITLAVTGTSPADAVRVGGAVTRSFVDAVTRLETVGDVVSRVQLDIVSQPAAPARAVDLPLVAWLAIGLVAGGIIGYLLVAFVRWLYPKWQASSPARRLDVTG